MKRTLSYDLLESSWILEERLKNIDCSPKLKNEIGKTRSKKSQAQAMLNRICVTPKGDEYSLVKFEKVGNKYHWVYEWINCPNDIKEITTNKVRSKTQLGLGEIMSWIDELRSLNVC